MIIMSKEELILAGRLLAEASNLFSRRNCNDMAPEMFEGISREELFSILVSGNCNDDPDFVPDWLWMDILSKKLLKEVETSVR